MSTGRRIAATWLLFGSAAVLTCLMAPLVGSTNIDFRRVFSSSVPFADNADAQIFFVARLPRVLAGALVGAAGGVSPSHFNSTDEADCAAAGKAQLATSRASGVSDASRLRSQFVKAFKANLVFMSSLTRLSGSFGGKPPHFEVVVSYHSHAFH